MDDGGDDEGNQLGHWFEFAQRGEEAIEIEVNVVVKPIMNHNIPFSIVGPELDRIPPVTVKRTVRESSYFWPKIHPAMQETKETHDKE